MTTCGLYQNVSLIQPVMVHRLFENRTETCCDNEKMVKTIRL